MFEKVKGYSVHALQRGHWLDLGMDWIKDTLFGDLKRMDARQVSDFTCLHELPNLFLNFN